MGSWPLPAQQLPSASHFGTLDVGCQLAEAIGYTGIFTSNGNIPDANVCLYIPFEILSIVTAYKLGWQNGNAVAGNCDVGIYDENLNKLVSTGSTPQVGSLSSQYFDIVDTVLVPGTYFIGFVANSTGNYAGYSGLPAPLFQACGGQYQLSTFPLPNPAVFAGGVYTTATVPVPSIHITGDVNIL